MTKCSRVIAFHLGRSNNKIKPGNIVENSFAFTIVNNTSTRVNYFFSHSIILCKLSILTRNNLKVKKLADYNQKNYYKNQLNYSSSRVIIFRHKALQFLQNKKNFLM